MITAQTPERGALRALLALVLATMMALAVMALPPQSATAVEAGPAPFDLSTNFLPEPVGVDAASAPTFRWKLDPSHSPSAYRIVVASSEQRVSDGPDVWDSGRVESDRIGGITYSGPALAEGERYFWSVMTWDAAGDASSWATVAEFGTGPGSGWSSADTIWVGGPGKWGSDFSLTLRAQFVQRHVTVAFRAADTNNYYLWQFRGAGMNELAVHRKLNADPSPAVIKTVPLGVEIENGPTAKFYDIRIEAEGDVIRTYLDDVLIDTTTDATLASGGFGFYSGATESFLVDDVTMTDPDGAVLYENDFEGTEYNDFGCGTLTGSALSIPTGQRAGCMYFGPWADYDLEVDVKVSNAATGILLRAADAQNNLMWQIRGDNSRIVPHTRINGAFTALPFATVSPAIGVGTTNRVKISARGDTFTTWINGMQVDSRAVAGIRAGGIGFRNGSQEIGVFSNLQVTSPRGQVVYENSFPTGDSAFPCGAAVAGELTVPRSADCVRAGQAGVAQEWAFLRGDVALEDKPVAWASLFTSGTSTAPGRQYVYRVWMNGHFVGAGPQQPAADENRFGGYDVTDLLRPGQPNTVGALAYSTQSQGFIAQMIVEYEDGTRQVFDTGRDWRSRGGSDVYPSGGSIGTSFFRAPVENLDARAYPFGFTEPGFDDSSWPAASARSALPRLAPSTTENLAEELHAPERIVQKGPGHYFIDFGRSWLGGVRLELEGAAGSRVEIRYGEELTDRTTTANTVRWQMRTGNNYRDYYTLSGGGEPLQNWGFRVFRYVEILGATEEITAENLQASALVYPMGDDARFQGDGEAIDAVWELSRHTIDSQNFDVYGDSWTRERAPYEADAFIQLQSHIYLDDDPTLAQFSVEYLLSRRTWPTEWPMYLILAAHELWQSTGDESFAAEHYDALVSKLPAQYLEEATGLIRKTSGSDGCSSRTDCDIVDWPAGERDGYQFRQYNTVVNALAYRSYRDMADIAESTGHVEDAARFTAIADRLREAMNTYLYDDDAGAFDDGMDAAKVRTGHHAIHASVFAQAFGVTADDQRETVGEYLAERGMQCSVYCAPFLLQALYDGDQGDAAYGLMTSTGQRSWMNMIALGAGATMEAWDPALKSNTTFSHPWASSPAFMIPRGLFGIRSIEPGYEKFSVKLQPGGLPAADVTVPTVRGQIRAAYAQEDARTDLGLQVPSGSTAVVSLPVEGTESGTLFVDHVETEAVREGAYLVVDVPAGCHYVSASRDSDPESVKEACPQGFDIDTTKPVVTLVSPSVAGPFPALNVQVDATDEAGLVKVVANIYKDGKLVKSTQTAANGAKAATHTASVTLPDGAYTVKYNASDLAGNVAQTGTFAFSIDATKPTATIKDGSSFTVKTGESYDMVSFKLYDAQKIDKVTLNGKVKDLSNNAWSDVNFIKPPTFGAVQGLNTLVVYDVAGNTQTYTFTLN